MKKFTKILAIMCVLAAFLFSFTACETVEPGDAEVTVSVVATDFDETFTVFAKQVKTLEDVLKALAEKDKNFTYTGSSSEYGLFIESICGKKEEGAYWLVYTDNRRADSNGVYNAFEEYTYEYSGKTYYSCAMGVSSQGVTDGEHFVFVLEVYNA